MKNEERTKQGRLCEIGVFAKAFKPKTDTHNQKNNSKNAGLQS